jgi:hypothetical protein
MLKRCPCCDYVGRLPVRDVKTIRDPRNRKHQITMRTHVCPRCQLGCPNCTGIHTTREEMLDVQRTSTSLR